jgi:NADPH2:quinone reductase
MGNAGQVPEVGEPADVIGLVDPSLPTLGRARVEVQYAPLELACQMSGPAAQLIPFTHRACPSPRPGSAASIATVCPSVEFELSARDAQDRFRQRYRAKFAEDALTAASMVTRTPDTLNGSAATGFWIPNATAREGRYSFPAGG